MKAKWTSKRQAGLRAETESPEMTAFRNAGRLDGMHEEALRMDTTPRCVECAGPIGVAVKTNSGVYCSEFCWTLAINNRTRATGGK